MKIDIPAFKTMAPQLQYAVLITLGGVVGSALLVVFAILPTQKKMEGVRTEIRSLNETLGTMKKDISGMSEQRKKTAARLAECKAVIASGAIEPLLGSFAMRGKSLLDPIAQKTGFTINNVRELPSIPLQVPSPPPVQLFERQPIEFSGQGSYTQITAFVSLAEASLPMTTLSGIVILSQPQSPENHKAIITFEWPAKGDKRRLP